MSALALQLEGETVHLLPQKALLWKARQMLVVADIHFGKAASFRALGVPVPHGTTQENLDALETLVTQHAVRHIVFLGDFLHARAAHAPATLTAMLAWRRRHGELRLTLVRGNHDRHAGDPAQALAIEVVNEPWTLGPFSFCHHEDTAAPGFILAGHTHPVYVLATRSDALRLPCFVRGARHLVLPSFGAFTGGHPVRAGPDEAIYLSSGDAIHPLVPGA
jgi:DNA ligase-associated metallophosphoesterase